MNQQDECFSSKSLMELYQHEPEIDTKDTFINVRLLINKHSISS